MSSIRLLSDQLINRIAAGEVVERPAAVLKELVENSLDAGSERIEIEAEAGGRRLVSVADNGRGMDPDDLLLAVERHATSKLSEETDLLKIDTLGFRGEALPSIGAVSRMTITAAAGEDGRGRRLRMSGGKVMSVDEVGRDRGVTVEIRDLFFNVPARRKFLKSIQTEAAHLLEAVQRYALGGRKLRLIYRHNGQELLSISPREDDRTRLSRVLGRDTARGMFQFEDHAGEIGVSGFLGRPDMDRARNTSLYLYVNGRPVKDRLLTRAVLESYRGRLAGGRYPAAVLFVDLDPELVDVNVHPAKTEVRFRRPGEVHGALVNAISGSLSRNLRPVPMRSRPYENTGYSPQTAVSEGAAQSFDWADSARSNPEPFPGEPERWSPPWTPADSGESAEDTEFVDVVESGPEVDGRDLKPIGQLFRSYILAQGPDGLYVIDQHAAHERILYEKMQEELSRGSLAAQGLLIPETLEPTPTQADALSKVLNEYARFGFELTSFGGHTFMLRAVPGVLAGKDVVRKVMAIIEQAGESGVGAEAGLARFEEALLSSLACHAAVKAGDEMTLGEMERLLSDLNKCTVPTNCPHGRPLIFSMPRREIEKRFKRI